MLFLSEIDNLQGIGQVTVGGHEWSARTEKDGLNLQPGTVVDIVAVSGVKLIVKEMCIRDRAWKEKRAPPPC